MAWLNSLLNHFALHPVQMFVLLFLVAFCKSTVLISTVLPPASVMLLAGITASHLQLPAAVIWLAITVGAASGSVVNYHLGRLMTRSGRFSRFTARHETQLARVRDKLQRNALPVLFTSRFLALLRYLVPLAAGMLRLPAGRVYAISALSAAVWAALFVGVVSGAISLYPFR